MTGLCAVNEDHLYISFENGVMKEIMVKYKEATGECEIYEENVFQIEGPIHDLYLAGSNLLFACQYDYEQVEL